MTTNYHTPWVDGSTQFKQAHMRVPLEELDEQITDNVAAIAQALALAYVVCVNNAVVCKDNEVVTNEPL